MKIRHNIILSLVLVATFLLVACDKKKENKIAEHNQEQIVIAKTQVPVQKLFYTGDLAPIKNVAVVSRVAGNITEVDFNYGQRIDDGQQLLVINSEPLANSYRTAVTDFLQKKQAYQISNQTFAGSQELYKAGVLAKADFISAKTDNENASLGYLQSQFALEKVLDMANINLKTIESLQLSNREELGVVLQKHFRHVTVNATAEGVALFPTPSTTPGDGEGGSTGKIVVGASVKEGQLLLSIGDLTGLSATFNASEVDINRIKKGMDVLVTGSAFPGITLAGVISSVSSQANQNSGQGGLSMFTVNVEIPKVSEAAMEKIRVGMTAKFEIDIKAAPKIMLPVRAVFQKNGKSYVTVQINKNNIKDVPVVTGQTTPTQVVIISGIKDGDKVVIHPVTNNTTGVSDD